MTTKPILEDAKPGDVLALRNLEETRLYVERFLKRPVDPGDVLTAARFVTPFALEGKIRLFDEQGAIDLAAVLEAAREDRNVRKWFKRERVIRTRVRIEDEELRVCRGEEPNTARELQHFDEGKREILDVMFGIVDRADDASVHELRRVVARVESRLKVNSDGAGSGR